MNDLMQNLYSHIEQVIDDSGSVVNMLSVQQLLNRIPQRRIVWKYAVDAMKESFEEVVTGLRHRTADENNAVW